MGHHLQRSKISREIIKCFCFRFFTIQRTLTHHRCTLLWHRVPKKVQATAVIHRGCFLVARFARLLAVPYILPLLRTQHALTQRSEFQLIKYLLYGIHIFLLHPEVLLVKRYRHIRDDRRQLFTHQRQLLTIAYLLAHRALYLICVRQYVLNIVVFRKQLCSSLFTHSRYARNVIHCIAHQPQHIYYLVHTFYTPLRTHLFFTQRFLVTECAFRFVDEHFFSYHLPVIFIRCHHVYSIAQVCCLKCQRPYYIISLISIKFQAWQVKTFYDSLYIRHRCDQVFWRLLPVGLVIRKIRMPLRRRCRIKYYRKVCRFFLV